MSEHPTGSGGPVRSAAAGGRRGLRGAGRSLGPDDDPEEVARQVCLEQLSFAPRTCAELAASLSARGVPAGVADRVLGRFGDVGLVDDAAFAAAWVSSRHTGRG
ncbi:MAG: recombination regulator RecX, partial [Actinomycetota bacterium]|nr:recombination regulator RecX [Actinomycetota bacterium]